LGRLVVRQSKDQRQLELAVVLSTDTAHYAAADEFELAVAAAASLAAMGAERLGGVHLVVGTVARRITATAAVLDLAAGVTLGPGGQGGLAAGLTELGRGRTAAGLVVMVTGSLAGLDCARDATRPNGANGVEGLAMPEGAVGVVVVCKPGAPVAVRPMDGLAVVTLGRVDRLGAALGRLV
jgi:hypothetical protein